MVDQLYDTFILEKRNREFAVYLLSGMKKKQVAALYRKENLCPGTGALFAGLLFIRLMNIDRQNETVNEKRNAVWKWLFYFSTGNVLFLYVLVFTGRMTKWAVVYPLDIILISDNTENDFAREEALIKETQIHENAVPRAMLKYCV